MSVKRLHQDEVDKEKNDWASLCGDMIRALVHIDPSLLPALYLVNKGFQAALDDNPNALHWEKYFNTVPGYSDYTPGAARGKTWKDLVKARLTLPQTYYLIAEYPCFACGELAQFHAVQLTMVLFSIGDRKCACGRRHTAQDPIMNWKVLRVRLSSLPVLSGNATDGDVVLGLRAEDFPVFGEVVLTLRPKLYTWNWHLKQICCVYNDPLFGPRKYRVVAWPTDIPTKQACRIARFVGFV
jgi:hypothetical protein